MKKSNFLKLSPISSLSKALKWLDKNLGKKQNPDIPKHYSHPKFIQVKVEFEEGHSIDDVVNVICKLAIPNVIVWYIGSYGLKKIGVDFYREMLINPILKRNRSAIFWLVDLTAWGAFHDSRRSIDKSNNCCEIIDNFLDKRIKCIRSSEIFKKMQQISSNDFLHYFKKALQRSFLCEGSKNYPDKSIQIREIFSEKCPIMSDWYNHDASKSYSTFQYLEGCLLVDEIFIQLINSKAADNLEIVFAIPNDELKYYRDSYGSFQEDVEYILLKRCAEYKLKKFNLKIKFLAFVYGTQLCHRPYNASGKLLKKNDLSYEIVVGNLQD